MARRTFALVQFFTRADRGLISGVRIYFAMRFGGRFLKQRPRGEGGCGQDCDEDGGAKLVSHNSSAKEAAHRASELRKLVRHAESEQKSRTRTGKAESG